MIITKDAINELTEEDRNLIWEAIGEYYRQCAKNVKAGHIAKDSFKRDMELIEEFMSVAFTEWERTYH